MQFRGFFEIVIAIIDKSKIIFADADDVIVLELLQANLFLIDEAVIGADVILQVVLKLQLGLLLWNRLDNGMLLADQFVVQADIIVATAANSKTRFVDAKSDSGIGVLEQDQ